VTNAALAAIVVTAPEKLQASNATELAGVLGRFSQATPLLEHQRTPGA